MLAVAVDGAARQRVKHATAARAGRNAHATNFNARATDLRLAAEAGELCHTHPRTVAAPAK